jgi:hypothetical protein
MEKMETRGRLARIARPAARENSQRDGNVALAASGTPGVRWAQAAFGTVGRARLPCPCLRGIAPATSAGTLYGTPAPDKVKRGGRCSALPSVRAGAAGRRPLTNGLR